MKVIKFKSRRIYKRFLQDKVAIKCKTFEECQAVVKFMIDNLNDDDREITRSEFEDHESETCITCEDKGWYYADAEFYEDTYEIISFRDALEIQENSEV